MSKLEEMLKYVSEHNEFYKNRIREYGIKDPLDITQWPILTRKELQENRFDMFSENYNLMYYSKQLLRRHSSGTSGIPVNIYWSPKDYFASMLSLWRLRKKYYAISPHNKRVSFNYGRLNENILQGLRYRYNKSEISVMSSSLYNSETFRELILLIQSYEPEWLYIQPSVLTNLIFYYQYFNMVPPKSIRYIETVGEILSESTRKKSSNFFNSIVANMYGSEEMNCIAYECPNNNMHILCDNVFVECLKQDNTIESAGSGDAIITNLNNKVMPLIRYYQGDGITLGVTKECLCEQTGNIVSNIEGRIRNKIINRDKIITPFMLVRAIDFVNNRFNEPIKKYKFDYYFEKKHLACSLWVESDYLGWSTTIKTAVMEQLKQYGFDILTININLADKAIFNKILKDEILTIHT